MQKIIIIIVCCFMGAGLLSQPNITRVEYFFNTDPGFGKATSITISAAPDLSNINVNLPFSGISSGLNTLYMRSKDANGKWSVTNRLLFVLISASASDPDINKAEYFIDTDPGFGKGTNIPLTTAAADIADKPFSVSLDAVTGGLHALFIRSRDANGRWSLTNQFLFAKLGSSANLPDIIAAEYFIGSDPGFGKGIAIPLTPANNITDLTAGINIAALDEGLHTFSFRSKDTDGKWSLTNRWLFVKLAANDSAITQVEYFIDSDPGFGKAVPIAINPLPDIGNYVSPVNITGLSVATHRLFIRSKNTAGKWSVTNKINFPVSATATAPAINVNAITITSKSVCGDGHFKLSCDATGTYNVGNTFTVQLSNGSGGFAAPLAIGNITATSSSIIDCNIPLHIANGSTYKVRVVSSNPVVTGAVSDTIFKLYNQPRFIDSTVFITCANEKVNLTNVFNTTGFTTLWNTATPQAALSGQYQLISSNTSLCKDTATVIIKQDVATWNGTMSKNWHTAANWSTGKIPSEYTHVIIVAGTPNPCELSASDVMISSLQVRSGAVMNVKNSRLVTITAKCNPLPD